MKRRVSTSIVTTVSSTKHFISVMKDGGTPLYTGEEGREITRYAMCALVSAQENRDVYVDEITTEAERDGAFRIETNFCNFGRPGGPETAVPGGTR